MAHLTLSFGRPALADYLFGKGLVQDAVLIASGVALTALAAHVTVPVFPIPLTGQTLAVLFLGSALGALRAALSMILYLLLGTLGLPLFSFGQSGAEHLAGSTGGYLVGFVAGAAFTGWMAQRAFDRTFPNALLSAVLGTAVIHAVGIPWLAIVSDITVPEAFMLGSAPILLGAAVKAVLVAATVTAIWRSIDKAEIQRESRAQTAAEW